MKQVWWVTREELDKNDSRIPTLFDTKEAAEVYARHVFPDYPTDKHPTHILCRDVLQEDDLNCFALYYDFKEQA
jgi:hypothetical protein